MTRPMGETPLGKVLNRVARFEKTEDLTEYQFAGIYSFARGVFVGERKLGVAFKLPKVQRIHEGDFVYSKIMAWEGAFGLVPKEAHNCVMSGAFVVYEIDQTQVYPLYLSYYFKMERVWRSIGRQSTGTNVRRRSLHPNQFEAATISLPSLNEQKRIVAQIERLMVRIEEARRLRQQAVKEAEALVNNEISTLFLKGKENGWVEKQLGAYVIDDCYGTSEKTTDDTLGTPILRMGNIQNGRLDLREMKYLYLNDKDRARLLLKKGDILVNRTNSAELVGKCAVFDLEGEYAFASYLIRLRLDLTRANPKLVASYINSPAGRAYMFSERKQMTGQANVNATKLKALPIALPSLPEQRRIVAYLDSLQEKVDELQKLLSETEKEIGELVPSILDKAFKGEL